MGSSDPKTKKASPLRLRSVRASGKALHRSITKPQATFK